MSEIAPRFPEFHLKLPGGVVFEMVKIRPGSFMMGSPDGVGWNDEHPLHRVYITRPFYMGKYPVTQAQYEAVMGDNPSRFKGSDRPVEEVSWHDAMEFIERLNREAGKDVYQLPTEAQWEYACRAGSGGRWCFGDDESGLGEYAWYRENSGGKTHPVGKKRPNAFGLYDMHGNVWEWCRDWYQEDYYSHSPEFDPRGPDNGGLRVYRGGGWDSYAACCRSGYRHVNRPGDRDSGIGFRPVRLFP